MLHHWYGEVDSKIAIKTRQLRTVHNLYRAIDKHTAGLEEQKARPLPRHLPQLAALDHAAVTKERKQTTLK